MTFFSDGFAHPFGRGPILRILAVALIALPLHVGGQETLSSVQREMERVEREIERERELHRQERARAEEFQMQKEARLQAIRDQIAATEDRADSLRARMQTERQRRAAQREIAARYQRRQDAFRTDLGREIDTVMTWLETDFPYQRERRISEWRDLAVGNEEATLPVEEVLMRLFGHVEASLDFAGNTEAYPGTYTTDAGARHEGFYVRAGAVLMVFSSNDGQVQAYLAKEGPGYVWRDEGLSSEVRNSIRDAVSVAQGREAPKLVPLPIELSAKGGAQ